MLAVESRKFSLRDARQDDGWFIMNGIMYLPAANRVMALAHSMWDMPAAVLGFAELQVEESQ